MRIRDFLLCLTLAGIVAGCATQPVAPTPGKGWAGQLVSYKKVVSAAHGIVGYVKTFEYRQESYPDTFRLHHVIDLDFRECGALNDSGTGTRYVYLPPDIARVKGVVMEEEPLTPQPFAENVAKLLGVPGPLQILPATAEDLKRASGPSPGGTGQP